MRLGTRRLVVSAMVLAASVLAGPSLVGEGPGAVAVPQDPVVVDRQEVVVDYPPIVGMNPTKTALQYPPIYCDTVFVAACDTIAVSVKPPVAVTEDAGYMSVRISLEWDDPTGTDDLDLYLWDDEEIAFAGRSVSDRNPEKVVTELTEFILVVNHAAGVNSGYRLRFLLDIEIFEKPFELLEPPAPGAAGGGGFGLPTGVTAIDAGPGAGIFGIPDGGDPIGESTSAAGSAVGKIELVPAPGRSVDIDFDRIQREVAAAQEAAAEAPASGGAGAAVWFWLVLLPLAAIGSAGTWLVRRRPASLKR